MAGSRGPVLPFHSITSAWFEERLGTPTEVQRRGWRALSSGSHALLVAPTGSGKTLAAFLRAIDELFQLDPAAPDGVRTLYVSPLKALVADIERNLREPLSGIAAIAAERGEPLRPIRVDLRTGDTPSRERQRQARRPGEILVTTPESLYLILGSKQRETLRTVTTVIVDEIHAVAGTKRGAHLALSLERLSALARTDPQRIGLSATVRPLESVASFLGGQRPVEIIDASGRGQLKLSIHVPVADMERVVPALATKGKATDSKVEHGLWPALCPVLVERIRAHHSTILFVNSRGLCERLTQSLNTAAAEEIARAHHGSVSHAERGRIEEALKEGRLPAIVATSSLELGIDMGAVDQVLLVESPGSVARGLQRVGRAGHGVGQVSRGRIYPKSKRDLLECAATLQGMEAGQIETLRIPRNCLDVLAQQIVAMCSVGPRSTAELLALVRRSHTYSDLSEEAFGAVLEMLSGHYQSTELADLRPRLAWDRARDILRARPGAALVARLNAGTIPDRGSFPVRLGADGPRLGELDEEMVFESRRGDTFLLGASSWRIESITQNEVLVSPAPGAPGRLPFWKGDGPGRPFELGQALGAFVRTYCEGDGTTIAARLQEDLPLDEHAAGNLAAYLVGQREHNGCLPTDRAITVERFRDELGDWRICLLSPFGISVHSPWAMAIEHRLSQRTGVDVSCLATDNGIVLRLADTDSAPARGELMGELFPDPEELEALLTERLGDTALFSGLFRENAGRALLVTRRRIDRRTPLWAQRIKARTLLASVKRYPRFPILLETYAQALRHVFDLDGLRTVLGQIRAGTLRVDEVEGDSASPFARDLVFAYVSAFLYEQDAPAAERRAQSLTLDRALLGKLLGQEERRRLLDSVVIDQVASERSARAQGWRARDHDELGDLLVRLGDLSGEEIRARCEFSERTPGGQEDWLARLEREGRCRSLVIQDQPRWIATQDADLFARLLGAGEPESTPGATRRAALEELLPRLARGRGPFTADAVAQRYGCAPETVRGALTALEASGVLVRGAFTPQGEAEEWCDADVLRQLKSRTLERLRREVSAVDGATLARFLSRWHGIAREDARPPTRPRSERLLEVVAQLEAHPLSWRALVGEILPRRLPGFRVEDLDQLALQGQVVWVGCGQVGARDGRIALFRREHVGILLSLRPPVPEPPDHGLAGAILTFLEQRGASFVTEIERALCALDSFPRRELEATLWALVWAGRITNDSFGPLRSLVAGRGGRGGVLAGGRWSLVRDLLDRREIAPTEGILATARVLLARYGIVSRDTALLEELPGGWGPLRDVLRAMEESGEVRRGWFVEGLQGEQYAGRGAADRLRQARREDGTSTRVAPVQTLSAMDPANPWGALLPWPEPNRPKRDRAPKPRRVPGARVVTVEGELALFLPSSPKRLTTFGDVQRVERALGCLPQSLAPGRSGLISIRSIDGIPVEESPHRESLRRAGFVQDYRGMVFDATM